MGVCVVMATASSYSYKDPAQGYSGDFALANNLSAVGTGLQFATYSREFGSWNCNCTQS